MKRRGTDRISYRVSRLTSRATAYAQIFLSIIYTIGYFYIVLEYMHGNVHTDSTGGLNMLLGALTAAQGAIIHFWFNRQRETQQTPESSNHAGSGGAQAPCGSSEARPDGKGG